MNEKYYLRSKRSSCLLFLVNLYNFQFKQSVQLFVGLETQS